MAITSVETQITWSAAMSITAVSSSTYISDVFIIDASTVSASIQVNALNLSVPVANDICIVKIAYSAGDVLGDTGNDYDTLKSASSYMILNTTVSDSIGENPARKTGGIINVSANSGKLIIICPQAGDRNITVRARLIEKRSS